MMDWKAFLAKHPRAKWIAGGAVIAAIAAGFAVRQGLSGPAQVPVLTSVERGDVVINVEATGTVDAVTTVNVGCQISGRIQEILVDFNSPVKKGQVLAKIEDTPFATAVQQADANLAAARAEVKVAEVSLETARADVAVARANVARAEALARQAALDYERNESLFASNITSAADRDKLKTAHENAQASLAAASAQVEQSQARLRGAQAQLLEARAVEKNRAGLLQQARTNLSYTVITSPIDGIVVARNIEVGQTVAARLSAPNLFNIAQDLEHMYVYTKLDVMDVSRVKVDQRASFTVDAFPKLTWMGKVAQVRISPITQMRGQSTPSQLGSQSQSSIPGLPQSSSGAASGPAGATFGPAGASTSGSSGSSGGGSSGGGGGGGGGSGSSGPVYYDALIEFANSDRRLLPGMTAYVSVPISAAYNVIRVRKEALRASPNIPDAEKKELLRRNGIEPGKDVLWVAEGSTYRPVAITIGTTDYLYVEITSGTVKEGQQVLAGYRERES